MAHMDPVAPKLPSRIWSAIVIKANRVTFETMRAERAERNAQTANGLLPIASISCPPTSRLEEDVFEPEPEATATDLVGQIFRFRNRTYRIKEARAPYSLCGLVAICKVALFSSF